MKTDVGIVLGRIALGANGKTVPKDHPDHTSSNTTIKNIRRVYMLVSLPMSRLADALRPHLAGYRKRGGQ